MPDFSTAELSRALEQVTDDIKREIVSLIEIAPQTVKSRVQSAYPVGKTGVLRSRVFVTQPRGFSTSGSGVPIPVKLVRATAPHVHIYQEGTRERFDATRKNARRGISPRHGRIFEAIAAQTRAEMLAKAQQIVDRKMEIG